MKYFPYSIGDFALATQYLTDEELGVFVRLRDHYLSTEMPLQCQWIALAMRTHCEAAVKNVLSLFFTEKDGAFHNEDFDKIIAEYREKAEKAAESARKRWGKTKENQGESQANTNAMRTQCDGITNAMLINKKEPINITNKEKKNIQKKKAVEKPDSVSQQVWDDFTALRSQKKAPITQTALNGIAREAEKAGITLEAALSTCCLRGWQGFKAEWIARENGTSWHDKDYSTIDYTKGVNPDGSF